MASLAAWLLLHGGSFANAWGVAAAGALGAAATAAWAWHRQSPAALSWDGSDWQWAGRDGDMRVMIDLDRWMLLRFECSPKGRCWTAASRRAAEGPWSALRAALYSRRAADPLVDAPSA